MMRSRLLLVISALLATMACRKPQVQAQETSQSLVENFDFSRFFPPAQGKRLHVGGQAMAKNLITVKKPAYPAKARAARIQGRVKLGVLVGKDGKVAETLLLSGDPGLAVGATDAVKQWVYQPTKLNGEPVEVVSTVDVNFALAR